LRAAYRRERQRRLTTGEADEGSSGIDEHLFALMVALFDGDPMVDVRNAPISSTADFDQEDFEGYREQEDEFIDFNSETPSTSADYGMSALDEEVVEEMWKEGHWARKQAQQRRLASGDGNRTAGKKPNAADTIPAILSSIADSGKASRTV